MEKRWYSYCYTDNAESLDLIYLRVYKVENNEIVIVSDFEYPEIEVDED